MNGMRLNGAERMAARLEGAAARLPARLGAVMARVGVALAAEVAGNLAGGRLKARSGRLAAAQHVRLIGGAVRVGVAVGFDPGAVPYGAIQEFGGTTRAHLIAAKERFALRFNAGTGIVFARRVQHPGSVIPAHSFLGAALAAVGPDAVAATRAAVLAGLEP
jgi:hypothetical protein